MESEISAFFTLTGLDFEPSEITAKVGIMPSKTWKIGDSIDPRASIRRKHNGWSVKSQLEKSADLEDHIKSVLEQLQPGWLSLIELCKSYYAEIECVIYIVGDDRPAIHFDKHILQQIGELNAEIDVDLYVLD